MKKVQVFMTSWCEKCHSLMEWMEQKEIEFEAVNVEAKEDQEALDKRMGGTFSGTPVTIVGEEIIEGFDRPAILKALE